MPAEEARTFLQQIQEKIASSDIEVPHRDVLIPPSELMLGPQHSFASGPLRL
jgi:hypothetical protein